MNIFPYFVLIQSCFFLADIGMDICKVLRTFSKFFTPSLEIRKIDRAAMLGG